MIRKRVKRYRCEIDAYDNEKVVRKEIFVPYYVRNKELYLIRKCTTNGLKFLRVLKTELTSTLYAMSEIDFIHKASVKEDDRNCVGVIVRTITVYEYECEYVRYYNGDVTLYRNTVILTKEPKNNTVFEKACDEDVYFLKATLKNKETKKYYMPVEYFISEAHIIEEKENEDE